MRACYCVYLHVRVCVYMAAMYKAQGDTLLTRSQLRALSYEDLVEVMVDEMRMDADVARRKSDAEMLMHFHDCECVIFFIS